MATEEIPEGWTVQTDPANDNRPYYCNNLTGATQWTLPTAPATATAQDDEKTSGVSVLVLGATGFVGRNLVKYLVDRNLATKIVAADKRMPALQKFNAGFTAAFKDERVTYVQTDLARDASIKKVFEKGPYNYVFNLCGETAPGKLESEYTTRITEVVKKCGAAAVASGIQKWVEVSDGYLYESSKAKANAEDAPLNKHTLAGKQGSEHTIAKYRFQAEELLRQVPNLPLVVLRPATIYGQACRTGIMQRIVCAAVYKHLDEKMKFLWSGNVKMNVVHVDDASGAMWAAATEAAPGSLYNLADQTNLDQGGMNAILEAVFGIKTGFVAKPMNWAAKASLSTAADHVNNKHVPAWSELCQKHGIDSQLSPFMDQQVLMKHHLCIDGSKITRETSFKYAHPKITNELVAAIVQDYIELKQFPPIL